MKQELNIVIMPDGSLLPEWADTKDPVTKSSELMQEEIYRHYNSEPGSWLLFLGFCDKDSRLSPSLSFFRRFAGLFTRKLTRTPDLETVRHDVKITVKDDELDSILNSVPMMTGSEYLGRDMLFNIWDGLSLTFAELVQAHEGTIESFIRLYSHDTHLVGRVFFHLVENKKNVNSPTHRHPEHRHPGPTAKK